MSDTAMNASIPMPLLPLLLLVSYILLAGVSLALRNVMYGRWRDEETARRGASAMLPMGARMLFAWALQPLWVVVRWTGIPANGITTLATMLGFGSGLAAANGDFALAGWLYLGAGICDVLDGRVARASGSAGPRGAAIDSVLDRYSDAAVLFGLAWYFRSSWVLLLAMTAMVGSLLVSYIRARGEGLGVEVKVGWMQRPERVVSLGAALALSAPLHVLSPRLKEETIVTFALAFVALMTQATAVQRLVFVIRKLSAERPPLRTRWRQLAAASVSSVVATGADFALVFGLHSVLGVSVWRATALGCLLGGAINFSLNRWWTFGSSSQPVPQLMRYTIVSVTSALFNSGGVALLLAVLPLGGGYVSWLIVRGVVFLCWNFPLQRDYVYGRAGEGKPEPIETGLDADRPITGPQPRV